MSDPAPSQRRTDLAHALLINGTVGSGKTSVADALGDLLAEAGVPHAFVDVDWLRRSWPCPPDDPYNTGMALRNLAVVARNYLDAGVQCLVLAGVLESRAERDAYQASLGVGLTVCRLRVDLETVRSRLVSRQHDGLAWFLQRAAELDRVLDAAAVDDFVIEASDGSPRDVAAAVLTRSSRFPFAAVERNCGGGECP
jgi:adenylylsulfate kinase